MSKASKNRLFYYVVRQKKLILYGVLATLLMSLVELFTGSLLKFLTKLVGKFMELYEQGFPKGMKLPVKYTLELLPDKLEFELINISLKGKDDVFRGILMLCLVFVGLFFLRSLFNYGRRVFMNAATQKILLHFKSDIYNKILKMPFSFFNRNKTGDVVSRVTFDVMALKEIIDLLVEVARAGIYVLVYLPIMFIISWQLSVFTLLFFPLSIILVHYVTRYIKRVGKNITDNVGDYTSVLEEKINHFHLIKSYSKEEIEGEKFDELVNKNYTFNLRLIKLIYSMNPTNDFLAMLAIVVAILIFNYKLIYLGANLGDIVLYIYLMKILLKPVKKVAQAWGQLHVALVSSKKIFYLLEEQDEDTHEGESNLNFNKVDSVQFKDVKFAYPDHNREVLKGVAFEAKQGDIISIEGKSGAGKSTLLKLLPAFFQPREGEILINGNPENKYALANIRSRITYVDSDTRFMGGSIRENIEYSGAIIPKEKEETFIQFIGLNSVQDLELVIGKDGADLSEGQKQRMSFIRAIVSKPSVLILDEAFSSLDKVDIEFIMRSLKEIDIVFLVSRKLEVKKHANKVVRIVNGVC